MKYLNKPMVFFLFMLFGYGVDTFTKFKIYNKTSKNLRVRLYYRNNQLGNLKVIKIGGVSEFTFLGKQASLCPTKVMVYEKNVKEQKEAKILTSKLDRQTGRITLVPGDNKWASYNQLNGCNDTYFELKVNPASEKIYAFFF